MPRPSLESAVLSAVHAALEAGWSVKSLADAAEIPNPMLYRWLSGQRGTSLETLERLAAFFGMRLTKPRCPSAP